jgi:hypothetical protein
MADTAQGESPFHDFVQTLRNHENYFVRIFVQEVVDRNSIREPLHRFDDLEYQMRRGIFVSRIGTARRVWNLYLDWRQQRATHPSSPTSVQQGGGR